MKLASRYYFIPQIIAILIVGPLAWMAFDRTPPLILHDGVIIPNKVQKNQTGATLIWRAHFSGRDCPGYSQREYISEKSRDIWPQLVRQRAGIFKPDTDNPYEGTVTVPPLSIPDMQPGPGLYQVTNIYECNWLQKVLHWPIVQRSPFVRFEVLP